MFQEDQHEKIEVTFFFILKDVNAKMKDQGYPGFGAMLVGSSKRTMIYIKSANDNQYDHDIQVLYNSTKNPISKKTTQLKNKFIEALYKSTEEETSKWKFANSTRVITATKSSNSKLEAKFDIALIDSINNSILTFNKKEKQYQWNPIGNLNDAYVDAQQLDKADLKHAYLKLKCKQRDKNKDDDNYKPSAALFIEAVHNVKNQQKG